MMNVLINRRVVVLALITLLAFGLRIYRLDAAGLSEDEAHKIEAVRAYERGIYTVNAEHPMLMKIMVTATVLTTERLGLPISTETALRLPNVIFGSLMTIVLYLFFSSMLGHRIGLLTAIIWAINPNTILISRIAKEDTLLVFFTWLGYYFCRRAKRLEETKESLKRWFYGLTGVSFGLMLASKFFLHYAGLNFLYYHLLGENEWNKQIKWKYLKIFFIFFVLTFLIANPVMLVPGIVKYMVAYLHEQTQTHHGYWMMGQLYLNDASSPSGGTPFYYYLLALAVKTPLPLLIAFAIGFIEIFRRRNDENYFFLKFMFIIWILPFSLFGAKWLRYMLSMMPTFSAITALGLSIGYDRLCALWGSQNDKWRAYARTAIAGVGIILFLVVPAASAIRFAPFYSLYVNSLGGGDDRVGYYFPQDEFYDLGLREAVQYIAREAPPGSVIANEAPSVINHYSRLFGRSDLKSGIMSNSGFQLSYDPPTYVLVQDGRRYVENERVLAFVEANYQPVKEVRVFGAPAVKIYKISNREENVQALHNSNRSTTKMLILQ
jgi:hypothetical protein